MRLGIMSDTHGNLPLMQRAADRMIDEFRVDAVVHLGDDLADAKQLRLRGKALYAVPGLFERAYTDGSAARRRIEQLGGISFFLSHTPTADPRDTDSDLNPGRARSRYGCDVLLHGHTHRYRAEEAMDGLIMINPGHLKAEEDRGMPATFAIVDASRPNLKVEIYDLAGTLVDACSFTLA